MGITNELNQEALARAGKQMAEAIKKFTPALAKAAEQYRKVFETVAESLPGWAADPEKWTFNPNPEEKLTRDEAFSGIHRRKKKGKKLKYD